MTRYTSDVAFSPSVKAVQASRGSRAAYARVERSGGFSTAVTAELRAFLATIDTAFLATASADGQPYLQHRGGPRGFIRAVDDATVAFVDFKGNRQYITTGNLADNDRVCLFLIDYATQRRVKIWGTARVVEATPALVVALGPGDGDAVDGRGVGRPEQVVLISVSAWDVNCPQHIPRKIDAADVARALSSLEDRIASLEAENRRLRALAPT